RHGMAEEDGVRLGGSHRRRRKRKQHNDSFHAHQPSFSSGESAMPSANICSTARSSDNFSATGRRGRTTLIMPVALPSMSMNAAAPRRRSQRILLVDDNPENLTLLSALLDLRGYSVFTAGTAEAAHEMISRQAPDLV